MHLACKNTCIRALLIELRFWIFVNIPALSWISSGGCEIVAVRSAALRVPLAVTWLTVYRQLQIYGKPTFGLTVLVMVLSDFAGALHAVL